MLSVVLGWLGNLLGGPFAKAALDAYKAKLDAGNTTDRLATDLATRELEVQKREAELQHEYKRALIGHWYEPANLAAYIFVVYIGKVVVWDTMLGLGTTPAIRGNVGDWMALIAGFLFAKRGAENVASVIAGTLKRK